MKSITQPFQYIIIRTLICLIAINPLIINISNDNYLFSNVTPKKPEFLNHLIFSIEHEYERELFEIEQITLYYRIYNPSLFFSRRFNEFFEILG